MKERGMKKPEFIHAMRKPDAKNANVFVKQ